MVPWLTPHITMPGRSTEGPRVRGEETKRPRPQLRVKAATPRQVQANTTQRRGGYRMPGSNNHLQVQANSRGNITAGQRS